MAFNTYSKKIEMLCIFKNKHTKYSRWRHERRDRELLPKPHIIQKYSTYNLPWNCDWKEACDRLLTSGENRRPPGKRKATANAQIHLELQGPQVDKTILKKKKVEGLILLIWKLTINLQWLKRFGTGIKDGHIDQWNGTESPEINLQLYN